MIWQRVFAIACVIVCTCETYIRSSRCRYYKGVVSDGWTSVKTSSIWMWVMILQKIQQCCLGLLFQIAHNAPIWHQISILTSSYTPFLVALRRYWGDPFVMSLSENYWEYVTWIKNKTKQCFRWWDPTLGFPCRPASTRSRQRTSRTSAYLAMVVEMELIIWKMMNTESWKFRDKWWNK